MESSIAESFGPIAPSSNLKSLLTSKEQIKIGLAIGNSRLHWGLFAGETLQKTWDTEHLSASAVLQLSEEEKAAYLVKTVMRSIEENFSKNLLSLPIILDISSPRRLPFVAIPLVLASVVPEQTALWQSYPDVQIITLERLPLQGLYPSLGIDRALALLGAGTQLGWPILVIDAGTALTFTGADVNRHLVGGAILPGLGLQLSSLGEKTAGLPLISLPDNLPLRWAADTVGAIESGVVRGVVAAVKDFIEDWRSLFPDSKIALTGGDRTLLLKYLVSASPDTAATIIEAPQVIFWGMNKSVVSSQ
jgi:type III pantothenate kinase